METKYLPVVLPGHAAVGQPAVSLEHALGENDIHIVDSMDNAPNIGDGLRTRSEPEVLEVHLNATSP